jgi:hypothetical protein
MQIKRFLRVLVALALVVGATRPARAQTIVDLSLLSELLAGGVTDLVVSDVSGVRTLTTDSGSTFALVVGTIASVPPPPPEGSTFGVPAEVAGLSPGDTVLLVFSADVSLVPQVSIEHCLRAAERTFDASASNELHVSLLGATITGSGTPRLVFISPSLACGYTTPGFSLVP